MERRRRGFTLIELLVVIAIIGILTAIATISFTNAQKSSRDTKRKADIEMLSSAVEMYKSEYKGYPNQATPNNTILVGGSLGQNVYFQQFISKIPVDPSSDDGGGVEFDRNYLYLSTLNGAICTNLNNQLNLVNNNNGSRKYALYASLENQSDTTSPLTNQGGIITQSSDAFVYSETCAKPDGHLRCPNYRSGEDVSINTGTCP